MRTTTFKCDRCGAEDTTNDIKLDNVGVHVGHYQAQYSYTDTTRVTANFNQEWCANCRIKAGLIENPIPRTVAVQPVTLEDLVREIACDAACDALANKG